MALACNGSFRETLRFPVKTDIKIILDNSLEQGKAKKAIFEICSSLSISTTWKGLKESRNGNFNSYTIVVILKSKSEMEILYKKLGEIPGVKIIL